MLASALLLLLRALLKPLTGEPNAAFLAAGAVIASNLLWIEHCRVWDRFDADRLLVPALLTHSLALNSLAPTIVHWLVQAGSPAWYDLVVGAVMLPPLVTISYLLCRISFSATEIRTAYHRSPESMQRGQPTQ
jgi:hypothetical protein